MKTILITGGAGFIGSHLADAAVASRYRTIIFDNLSTGERGNIPRGAIFVKGDVREFSQVQSLFKKYSIDIVFHLAGQASHVAAFTDPTFDSRENFEGTIHLVRACLQFGVPRFLYASSMTVYGHPTVLPVSESNFVVPISYYGISKYAAERFVLSTGLRPDLSRPFYPTALRMFNVYGSRQSLTNPYQGVLAIFLGNILRNEPVVVYGDGKQTRDFIYIHDVVRAWMGLIDAKKSYHQVFNLGAGSQTSVNVLIRKLMVLCGKNPRTYRVIYKPARPGEQRFMQADMSRIKKITKYVPRYTLDKGLAETIAWASEHVL